MPTTPADQNGCIWPVPSPFRAAFPVTQAGRHPHRYFRGLLGLYSLRPTGSLSRPRRPSSQGSSPLLSRPPVSYSINRLTIEVESSSTGNTRLRGALGKGGQDLTALARCAFRRAHAVRSDLMHPLAKPDRVGMADLARCINRIFEAALPTLRVIPADAAESVLPL